MQAITCAAEMEDLWGANSDDSDGSGGAELNMAEHEMRVLRGRMANLGFQSTVGEQYEELLQHGFEAGMTGGLTEGRDVGYWVGVTAALQALPAELREAVSLPEEEIPTVGAAQARVRQLATERFEQANETLRQRAERFEASNGVSEESLAPSGLLVLEPGNETQLLAPWAREATPNATAARMPQPLMLGLPHRVFIHSQPDLAVQGAELDSGDPGPPSIEELGAAVSSPTGRLPRLVSSDGWTASEDFCSVGSWPSSLPSPRLHTPLAEHLLPLLKKRRQDNGTAAGGDATSTRVHGRVYAVDDAWLATLDKLHSNGTRCSVEITLPSHAADATDAAGAGVRDAIICQSWLSQIDQGAQ